MEKEITFSNSRTKKTSGVLSIVDENKKSPLVILVHGFGAHKDAPGNKELSENFSLKEVNNFRFDLPGHGQSKESFEDFTTTQCVNDLLSVILYIKNLGYFKIGLVGTSFGGLCCIIAASKSTDLQFLVLRSPVSDYYLKDLMTKTKSDLVEWKERGFRVFANSENQKVNLKYSFLEDVKKLNSFALAEEITIPTFIVHGDNDKSIPIIQSEMLVKGISNSNLKIIVGADHRYTNPILNKEVINLIIEFILTFK